MIPPESLDDRHLPALAARPLQRRREGLTSHPAREHGCECSKLATCCSLVAPRSPGLATSIIVRSGGEVEFRRLGQSGLKVPVLSFGTGTFGGGNDFFRAWGATDVAEATQLVDVCLEAGVNMFDSADTYSRGLSEEILGKAVAGRRHQVLLATKASFKMGDGPNDI